MTRDKYPAFCGGGLPRLLSGAVGERFVVVPVVSVTGWGKVIRPVQPMDLQG